MSKEKDYGTASHEEIISGIALAGEIAGMIHAVPNPAVQNMVKKLITQIVIFAPAKSKLCTVHQSRETVYCHVRQGVGSGACLCGCTH